VTIAQRLWLMASVLMTMVIGLGSYGIWATQGLANSHLSQVFLSISVLSVILGLGMTAIVVKGIKQRIQSMEVALLRATQEFDFTAKLPIKNDEFHSFSLAINQLFEQLQQGISEVSQVVGALSQGDMTKRVAGLYLGDLDKLKQQVNQSADNITSVIAELSTAMGALSAGTFDVNLKVSSQGIYGKILNDVSFAMKRIHGVVSDLNEIMYQMSLSNFEARVNANARGDLEQLKHNVNRSMEQTAQVIRSIVDIVSAQAEGDLTKSLPEGVYHGQFHDLKNAMTYSNQRVKESVIKAVSASHIVNEAAREVSQGSFDLSGRVQKQVIALQQTSSTMNAMAIVVQANTNNANSVADLVHEVQDQACDGVGVMQQTIGAMQSIKESSSKIVDIVSLIDGIAFQTNLLALNASVEAARAGEQGKGFAIVAGEVRGLAQKAAAAATDIRQLIDESVSRIELGTQLADKSGEMLNGIRQSIERVTGMIEDISKASIEQSQGISQVHRALADIDRVTQENATLVDKTTVAAESLSTEADHLKNSMGFFKI
jgi:methyl-accepting chemotaxis protein